MYIVTGASFGIGRAVAAALASRGLRVAAVARSADLLDSLAAQCHRSVTPVVADLATDAGIGQVVAATADESGIEGLVHSAGSLVPLEPYQSLHPDELVDHFRIHVAAPISLYQSLAKKTRIKRMVFIDSYSASTARLGWSAYSIVKSAAQMAAMCAAQELDQTDTIRVFPGAVNTRVVDSVLASDTESAKAFAGMQKRGELAEPDEVASFIVKLLVDAPDDLIRSQPAWDYNAPDDRASLS